MGAESVGSSEKKPGLSRWLRKLAPGTRVEVLWTDSSGCMEEDGEPGNLGGLHLLSSVGYVSGFTDGVLVTVRNRSLSDGTYRDTESVAVENLVAVSMLGPTGDGAESSRWVRRGWVRELMRGAANG